MLNIQVVVNFYIVVLDKSIDVLYFPLLIKFTFKFDTVEDYMITKSYQRYYLFIPILHLAAQILDTLSKYFSNSFFRQ